MAVADSLTEWGHAPISNDQEVRPILRLSLFDWAACGHAGVNEPVSQTVRNGAVRGQGNALLIGGGMSSPEWAALINGTTSHALDYDDTHFAHIGHPSVVVMSATLALAGDHTPEEVEDALLIGAEASVRVGQWLGCAHYQAGYHMTATAGAIGATLGLCRLLGLTPDQTRNAFGLVATRAAGLKSMFGTMGKPFNAGQAAEAAVLCATLARHGFVANLDALDGPQGFGSTHFGEDNQDAFDNLGKSWVFEGISHKYHACCHGLHAMLEAMGEVGDVDAQDVRSVTIRTNPRWLSVCHQPDPQTGLACKFSYRHTAAMALLGVDTGALSSFSDSNAARPDLTGLRQRVEVVGDDTLSETAAVVVVRTDHDERSATRDIAAPLPYDVRKDKLRHKAQSILGHHRAEALWRATGDGIDLTALRTALATPL